MSSQPKWKQLFLLMRCEIPCHFDWHNIDWYLQLEFEPPFASFQSLFFRMIFAVGILTFLCQLSISILDLVNWNETISGYDFGWLWVWISVIALSIVLCRKLFANCLFCCKVLLKKKFSWPAEVGQWIAHRDTIFQDTLCFFCDT